MRTSSYLGAALVLTVALVPELAAQTRDAAANVATTDASPTSAAPRRFALTVDNIMRGPELYGTAPSRVRFSDDSRYVYFRWKKPGVDTADVSYRAPVAGGEPERLTSIAEDTLYPEPGQWSRDRRLKVFAHRGDIFLWDAVRGARRRLTDTPGVEGSPQISADGRTGYFVRDNNLYSLSLEGSLLSQLTDIRRGAAPRTAGRDTAARDSMGQRAFLRAQQRELFEFIRRPPRQDNPFQARADSDTTGPKPLFLTETQTVQGWDVSPDGQYLMMTVSERPPNALVQTLPLWVTASGYLDTQPNRTKVGDVQPTTKVGIMKLLTGQVTWIDVGLGHRRADVGAVAWSASGQHALLRGQSKDFNDRWLWVVDVPEFAPRQVDLLHDSAWVGQLSRPAGWLRDSETLWFTSEATGWAHLYTVPASGGTPRALTSGQWEVQEVELSPDGHRFYFHSSEVHFGEHHLYAMGTGGDDKSQLTRGEGRNDAVVSPDDRWLAILHSTANHPPELYIQMNRAGAPWRQVTESTSQEFRSYAWRLPELVMVPARDGVPIPARLYRPEGHGNGAAVIFVHGAGYAQNVHKWWSSYSREYMFHHLLAERGFAVLDMDYRASAGHGRDWRTAIYRHMGGTDLDDNVDGARWLVRSLGIDSSRIGIYGGSYGGFITLMAMFTAPGVFRAGAALRPVTDWAHYNHGYTAAILNEPQEDSVAYRRSSPIYFADGLRGSLLICHGLVDDNVNFQDTARLVQRLIELRKEGWQLAIYPVEPHGFRMASSWADEYKRILALFETNLRAAAPVHSGG